MKFIVGFSLEEFKRYYEMLDDLHEYFKTIGPTDSESIELGETKRDIVERDPSHLIIWNEDDEIIGHAIWHEATTDEHKKGDPREEEDRDILERLLGGKKDLVELHEVWLKTKHRGRGYGKRFFQFFEDFVRSKGHDAIAYYTDHPAAIAICRERGYREDYLEEEGWHVFCLQVIKKSLKC